MNGNLPVKHMDLLQTLRSVQRFRQHEWFSFRGAAGLLSFAAAVRSLWLVAVSFLVLSVCLGCVRFGSLSSGFPPLVSPLCLLVQSVLCWSLPTTYLVVSATVRLSYLRYGVLWLIGSCLHSSSWQQASALCGVLPSPPCCGCCSGTSRTCTELFALG